MKLLIASDIHGSARWCEALLERFQEECAHRLLLLGDILYHGPRNPLPDGYDPQKVAALLNAHRTEIFCVRGNCDSEVDQMVLEFPILGEYALLPMQNRMVFATHGHVYNLDALPPLAPGDILLHGHTHLPSLLSCGNVTYINPGSVALPKENNPHSYMILEGDTFTLKNLETGEEMSSVKCF